MELNQTVTNLQEEVKLLKGEIKAVLREIRTAVLSEDNPFSLDTKSAAAPAVQTVAPPAVALLPEVPNAFSVPATPPPAAPAPQAPPAPLPQPQPAQPAPQAPPAPTYQPQPSQPAPAPQDGVRITPDWNLLTVAGLMLWAEDAVATLGAERLRIVLELATFAELLPSEARDVLMRVSEIAPKKDLPAEQVNVIDCVVALHQLEAILGGQAETRLPRRRDALLRRVA